MRLRLDESVRRLDHGRVLIGGSPLVLLRLSATGALVLDCIVDEREVPTSVLTERLIDLGAAHPVPDRSSWTEAHVTVVIPTRDDDIGPLEDALRADGVFDVIVVDDGSRRAVAGARLRHEQPLGPGAARNAGAALVTTPFVAFVDADVLVESGWLRPLLDHFSDPQVAMVAPRVRSLPGTSVLARYEERHSPLDLGDRPGRVEAGSRVGYVPAAALVMRTESFVPFDVSLRYGEDVDAVWGLVERGQRIRYEPAGRVWHLPRPSPAPWWSQRVGYGSSAAPLARRHPGCVAPVRVSSWSVAAWVSMLAGEPVAAAAIVITASGLLRRKLRALEQPGRECVRLVAGGTWGAGRQLASGVRRAWWPIIAVVAVRSRMARRVLACSVVDAVMRGGPLVVLDDVAYSVGLWRGVRAERSGEALWPDLTSWPKVRARRSPSGRSAPSTT